jgi:hypothetical protein
LYNNTFLDIPIIDKSVDWSPSEYLLFVKNTTYDNNINKLSLIIVSKTNGYVVNNDFKFNSMIVDGNKYTFYTVDETKTTMRTKTEYWVKEIPTIIDDIDLKTELNNELDMLISDCETQARMFYNQKMDLSEASSSAMGFAYKNIKMIINNK